MCAEVCLDGVHDDVARCPNELFISFLKDCAEAVAKQMRVSSMTAVEAECIATVELFHRMRQPIITRAQEVVDVIRHQGVGEALEAVSLRDPCEARKEVGPV